MAVPKRSPRSLAGASMQMRTLERGLLSVRAGSSGFPHAYTVSLLQHQAAQVVIDQHDTDLLIKVVEPGGRLSHYDQRDRGPEFITLCGNESGTYRLEISAVDPRIKTASYDVSVELADVLTDADEMRMAAEAASNDGKRLASMADLGSRKVALERHLRGLRLWQSLAERTAEAASMLSIAELHYHFSEFNRSREYFEPASRIFRRIRDYRGVAESENGLGLALWRVGKIDEAVRTLQRALTSWRAAKCAEGEAATLSNIGILNSEMGESQKALEHFSKAREVARSLKDTRGEGSACHNIGMVHSAMGNYARALKYLDLAIRLLGRSKDHLAQAKVTLHVGRIHLLLNDLQSALHYGQQALQRILPCGDRRSEAEALRHLGQVAEGLGNLKEAEEHYVCALDAYREVGNPQGEGAALHALGVVHFHSGDNSRALRFLRDAWKVRRKIGAPEGKAETLHAISRIDRRLGRLAASRRRAESAIAIAERLRTRIAGPDLRASYFSSKQGYYAFYIEVLMCLHRQKASRGLAVRAFEASERARARSLLDLLSEPITAIEFGRKQEFTGHESQLRRRIRFWSQRLAHWMSRGNTGEIEKARQELERWVNAHQEVEARIRAASPAYAELVQPQPLTLIQVQRKILNSESTLLHFAFGEENCYLWVITTNSIRSFDLGPRGSILEAARRLYDLLTTSPGRSRRPEIAGECGGAVADLSRLLLPPSVLNSAKKRLVIAADGILQYIPFAMLLHPASSQPLVTEYEIVNVPSISALAALRNAHASRQRAKRTLAVIADPVFDVDDPRVRKPSQHNRGAGRLFRLSSSRVEAEEISRFMKPNQVWKAYDFAAAESVVTTKILGQYRIVHIASHALVDDERPELSALVLSLVDAEGQAQDGFIRADRILKLRLLADLVVLSACRTGLGRNVRGEGIVGLTRSFMYAGAATVAVSLWKIDDEATSTLMKFFYEAMFGPRRLRPAGALRVAQVAMLNQKRWNSPYYWAGFTIHGEWRQNET